MVYQQHTIQSHIGVIVIYFDVFICYHFLKGATTLLLRMHPESSSRRYRSRLETNLDNYTIANWIVLLLIFFGLAFPDAALHQAGIASKYCQKREPNFRMAAVWYGGWAYSRQTEDSSSLWKNSIWLDLTDSFSIFCFSMNSYTLIWQLKFAAHTM